MNAFLLATQDNVLILLRNTKMGVYICYDVADNLNPVTRLPSAALSLDIIHYLRKKYEIEFENQRLAGLCQPD